MVQSLNDLIRHLRHDRGVALAETKGSWSIASMSRFENGEIDLADSVVSQVSVPLGLDYEDLILRHLLAEDSLDSWIGLASESWNEEQAATLLEHLTELKVAGSRNDFLQVAIAVISQLLTIHASGAQNMDSQVVKQLDDYLSNLDEFSRLEGFIFSVCSEYVPVATGWVWMSRQVNMIKEFGATDQRIRRVISYCAGVAERAAIEREFKMMHVIIDEMRDLDAVIPENAMQRYNLKSLETLYADLTISSAETHQRFVAVVKTSRMIFAPDVYHGIVKYTIAQGWTSRDDFE